MNKMIDKKANSKALYAKKQRKVFTKKAEFISELIIIVNLILFIYYLIISQLNINCLVCSLINYIIMILNLELYFKYNRKNIFDRK